MKPHPRLTAVQKAECEIAENLLKIAEKHELTEIEVLQILNRSQTTTLKYMLRAERHPDNPELSADEE